MKAVVLKEYGNVNNLNYEEVEKPLPKDDEILIKVRVSAVNPVDWKIRDGFGETLGLNLPIILGCEIAGVVEATGADVQKFKTGDEVFGYISLTRNGGYAEFAIAKESEIVQKPQNIDFENAAAIGIAALTAWQAIFDTANLTSGQKILIHGGAGGVGSMAVQLAKAKDTYVLTTASSKNEEFVKDLGTDEYIDYTKQKFEDVARNVDVVLDTIGGDTQERSFQILKKGGFLVSTVAPPSKELAEKFGIKAEMLGVRPNIEQLVAITKLVEEGKIKTHIETVLPLSEVKKAHELSQSGHTRGKIVMKVSD